ncbi:MAG TPA: methyltransferase domain-containing protein [Solirubrobacteraceae bacterium]|nr:methyltransferase domain-containing protein [Solirubrobacteraceae bacterium]
MTESDPDQLRALARETWEAAAAGWGREAEAVRNWGMPVSVTMVESLGLQPGQRVLELAAGPGDTGFMAAELLRPAGTLISSDGAEPMIEVARARAAQLGIDNVEFRQLELEWIDLETASVDAVLVRWGIMLTVDPPTAAREIRRVLKPGGHAALAVWDARERNPWALIPSMALMELGHTGPPDPNAPGPFALAESGRLAELLDDAGFTEVEVVPVDLERHYASARDIVAESANCSPSFGTTYQKLTEAQQEEVAAHMVAAAAPYTAPDGSVTLPGVSLVARATG